MLMHGKVWELSQAFKYEKLVRKLSDSVFGIYHEYGQGKGKTCTNSIFMINN